METLYMLILVLGLGAQSEIVDHDLSLDDCVGQAVAGLLICEAQ